MRDNPNLDFLRSVAVLSVVLEHTLLALHVQSVGPFEVKYIGVIGVAVFFVLTTLVLMWSLERKPHTLDFYIRRIFRIYPLALVMVALAITLKAPTGGTPANYFAVAQISHHKLLEQFTLLQQVMGTPSSLGVTWSLGLEILMYALLPALFFFIHKNFSLWPLLVLWAVVAVCSFPFASDQINFCIATNYFLAGVMAYVGYTRHKPFLPAWLLPILLLVAWLVLTRVFTFKRAWFFCLALGLALPFFLDLRSRLVLSPSRTIAKYSYGIYLTHPFAIIIAIYLLPRSRMPIQIGIELLSIAALSLLAYHLIEHPFIRMGSKLAARAEKRYQQRQLEHFRPTPVTRL